MWLYPFQSVRVLDYFTNETGKDDASSGAGHQPSDNVGRATETCQEDMEAYNRTINAQFW